MDGDSPLPAEQYNQVSSISSWTPEQIEHALWFLGACLLFALLAFVYTAWRQVKDYGMNSRAIMGMKPRPTSQREREARAETRRILERQRKS